MMEELDIRRAQQLQCGQYSMLPKFTQWHVRGKAFLVKTFLISDMVLVVEEKRSFGEVIK